MENNLGKSTQKVLVEAKSYTVEQCREVKDDLEGKLTVVESKVDGKLTAVEDKVDGKLAAIDDKVDSVVCDLKNYVMQGLAAVNAGGAIKK